MYKVVAPYEDCDDSETYEQWNPHWTEICIGVL
jgi:hypothetical protein